jgi:vancomycin resistance protein YoaR
MNGVLIAPDEVFSFNKAIGDISRYTGYKEAYVISGGKTILGDGGGVCQVSTTLFRAALNTGLPIEERHGHAYRVGYYEQQSSPGLDATIYVPSVDFKFRNDTPQHILIQSYVDPTTLTLTFTMYGTKDGREVSVTTPVIKSQTPAPETRYQDDPTLPKDTVKQVEYAAPGAVVSFSRTVMKDGKVHISDTYTTRYRPWGAVFLRGTKEG